ncbi:MAG: hypothetical protein QM764_10410 [Chitinophagaceae bacterium]
MKCFAITILFLVSFSKITIAQDTATLKRAAYKLKIEVDKDNYYEEQLKETPYIWPDNTIQLYPGEKIYVEVEQSNWIISAIKAVKENKNPAKTLEISFIQSVEKDVHKFMTLKIHNPFQKELKYQAVIFILNKKKFISTNVYPVGAGLDGIEIWQDLITTIGLGSWSFAAK